LFAAEFPQNLRACIQATLGPPLRHCVVEHFYPTEAKLKRIIFQFLSDETGATAIEYGLIAAGIALAIIAAVNGLGSNLNNVFTSVNSSLK
jgi:pilus assembly protein Flp/PilA